MKLADEQLRPRNANNFDAIRLALAMVVILSHSYPLLGYGTSEPVTRLTYGQMTGGNWRSAGSSFSVDS
jgi:hypothetical protein